MLLPDSYAAVLLLGMPRPSASVGGPGNLTASLKLTLMRITLPAAYAPSGTAAETFRTSGTTPSSTMSPWPASELALPGSGSLQLYCAPVWFLMTLPAVPLRQYSELLAA